MRSCFVLAFVVLGACGDNGKSATPPDGTNMPMVDAAPDANPSDLIAAAKAAADGTGLSLPISHAVVTFVKPAIGDQSLGALAFDPAGFTIQAQKTGPAMFIAVDPATTSPALVKGDIVSFTITDLATVGSVKRATAIASVMRHSQGFDVTTLSQDVSAATDLVSAADTYESELVKVMGTITGTFAGSGGGFEEVQITTAGMSASATFLVRVPSTLRDEIDMATTCGLRLNDTPFGKFNAETQLAAFTASDIALDGCPAPTVVSAIDVSSTSIRVTFSRHVKASSVMADGSQFTFDNGLTASAATVSGKTVTVTTSAQVADTNYTVTVANTVTDTLGSAVATTLSASFIGFEQPASVKLNEVNANVTNGCDLIELRVTASGTLRGIRVAERNGDVAGGELRLDLPDVAVAKNDIVVVHLDGNDTTNCNVGASTNETTAINQNLAATFTKNYDTAWDLFSTDTGLTATDNVITVRDRFGVMVDAVLIENNDNSTAVDSETAAAAVAAANQWQMVGGGIPAGGFADATFTTHAVIDSDSSATVNQSGANSESLRRVDDTDDNDKADWAQGTNTWGLINANQTPIP